MADFAMTGVGGIVVVGHEPLVYTEHATWFQDPEDLAIYTLQARSMHSRLNSVHSVERVLGERHLHEVSLHKLLLICQTSRFGVVRGALNLVVVVVEANNIDTRETGHFSGGPAYTTANVEDGHPFIESHHVC
jgi:hypothetical protein